MLPGFPRVRRLVNPIAHRQIGPMQSFAARYIDDLAVRRSHGDRADRLCRLAIEYRLPGAAVVVGLPPPAIHLAHVEDIRLAPSPSRRARAPAAKRPHQPPMQVGTPLRIA